MMSRRHPLAPQQCEARRSRPLAGFHGSMRGQNASPAAWRATLWWSRWISRWPSEMQPIIPSE
eukprot:scaffold193685_cov14-Prasinocladus_malaysianus.AAC.1